MNNHSTSSQTVRQLIGVMVFCAPLFTYAAFPGSFGGSTGGDMPGGGATASVQTSGTVVMGGQASFGGRATSVNTAVVEAPASSNSRAGSGSASVGIATGPAYSSNAGVSTGQVVTSSSASSGVGTQIETTPADNSPRTPRSRYQVFTNPVANTYKGGIRVISGTSAPATHDHAPVRTNYVPAPVTTFYNPAPSFTSAYSTPTFTVYTATPAFDTYTSVPTYVNYVYPNVVPYAFQTPSPVILYQIPQWVFTPWNPAYTLTADYTDRIGTVSTPALPVADPIHIIHIVH